MWQRVRSRRPSARRSLRSSRSSAFPPRLERRSADLRSIGYPLTRKETSMLKIGIITGSTRPNRQSPVVATWVLEAARKRSDAEYELFDIKDFELPLLDEPMPPSMGKYEQPHTKRWAAKIASMDAFVFVSPEYNHGIPGALKNAIDFLFAEWSHKAAGFVSYGGASGARAVEHLRLVLAEVHVATVRAQLLLSIFTDFERFTTFTPAPQHEKALSSVLDEVLAWTGALKPLRS